MTKTGWTQRDIYLATVQDPAGRVLHSAMCKGPFAVHRVLHRPMLYTVTHIITGWSLEMIAGWHLTERDAMTAADAILPLRPDWEDLDPDRLMAMGPDATRAMGDHLRAAVAAIAPPCEWPERPSGREEAEAALRTAAEAYRGPLNDGGSA